MREHTSGPWTNHGGLVSGADSRPRFRGQSIAIFNANEWPADMHAEAIANARLVAAAPELLAALKDLLFAIKHELDLERFEKTARAAIAKATGAT